MTKQRVGDPKDPKNLSETLQFRFQGTNATLASRSDITTIERWNLVQERASKVITELLLLFFSVILLVVRPLRSFVDHFNHFDHRTSLLGRLFPMPQQLWNPFLHALDLLIIPLLYVHPFIDPFPRLCKSLLVF
jgi:hypothetical protein